MNVPPSVRPRDCLQSFGAAHKLPPDLKRVATNDSSKHPNRVAMTSRAEENSAVRVEDLGRSGAVGDAPQLGAVDVNLSWTTSADAKHRLILTGLAVLLGVSYGLSYGASNQLYYLLPALKHLHPELLQRDWVVSSSHNYHPAYGWLSFWIMKLDAGGALMAILSVATVVSGVFLSVRLVRTLSERSWFLSAVLIVALCMATRTAGPGGTSVYTGIFQPSSLGVVGFLAAAVAWARGRPWHVGWCLAFAGVFHANYLVLSLAAFGCASLVYGAVRASRPGHGPLREWGASTLGCVGPPLLALAWLFPLIWATAQSPLAAEANRLYQDVRGPHHYDVARFWPTFVPWMAWQALGMGSLWDRRKQWGEPAERLLALLVVMAALVASCVFFSTVWRVRSINHLFAWRIAPIGALLAQVAFLTSGSAGPRWQARSRIGFALQLAGATALGLNAHFNRGMVPFALFCGCCALWEGRYWAEVRGVRHVRRVVHGLALGLFALAFVPNALRIPERSNLMGEPAPGLGALCGWVQANTDLNSVFLIPPDLAEFRFWCRRAVVIDWKADPLVPEDFLEWVRRMEAVTGRSPLSGPQDMEGYASLDADRLRRLQEAYGADYVVTRTEQAGSLGVPSVFHSSHFEVFPAKSGDLAALPAR